MRISNYDKKNIIKKIDYGSEAIIYLYKDNGEEVALKIYYDNNKEANNNKELKIQILQNESVLNNDMKILSRVYSNGKFIGFTSKYEPYMPLSFLDSREQKIYLLKLIKNRYEELNTHRLYIGDFNIDNFSLENGRIKLFDIDNFRIDDLDFNIVDTAMMEYRERCKFIYNIDYYCFNWFALSLLSGIETDAIIRDIGRDDFPRFLKTPEIKDFIKKLDDFDDNFVIEKTKDGKPKTLLNLLK